MTKRKKSFLKWKPEEEVKYSASQYEYVEIGVEPSQLDNYSNEDMIHMYDHCPHASKDEIAALHRAIDKLTLKQKTVVNKWLEGKSQTEIANELGILQNAVHKSLFGSPNYSKRGAGERGKLYGGSIKKLRRFIEEDREGNNKRDDI